MRWPSGGDVESGDRQGEIIEISVRSATLPDLDSSDELLQTGWWGNFKQSHGWQAHPFRVTVTGRSAATFGLLVLTRVLLRRFRIAYVPFGPTFDPEYGRGEYLSYLAEELRAHLPPSTLFLRFDLPWEKRGEEPGWGGDSPRVGKSRSDIQPPNTVLVDISPPLVDVLAAMKPKTRYNVRLAEKKGVIIGEESGDSFDSWYSMYKETSRRDRIAIHSSSYYKGLFTAGLSYPGKRPVVSLFAARHEGDLLAGNICVFWKKRGVYFTGASSNVKRNLMPTYALQWEAMQKAKEAGCIEYDLYGIPPEPDPGHPMYGLYQFKTGFSERIIERWGTWDVLYRPGFCFLYGVAEEARLFYFRSLKKRLRRR
jgi:lipid II:glycine glycyltransferase (peptidoglycan interpeptide bridge formation enzyme)